jgi:hypothetical protein
MAFKQTKSYHQSETDLVKDENDDLLADSHIF